MTYKSGRFDPQIPKVFKGGVGTTPEFFSSQPNWYVFGIKVIMKKIRTLLHDLENHGQTHSRMTVFISGCEHDTNLIEIDMQI